MVITFHLRFRSKYKISEIILQDLLETVDLLDLEENLVPQDLPVLQVRLAPREHNQIQGNKVKRDLQVLPDHALLGHLGLPLPVDLLRVEPPGQGQGYGWG